MGVVYKLRQEVVHFIISQRQSNPLASCRQLAESTSQKFGLPLSKSSVHDVLKEFGITTPRGRKPKDKFEIPQEKKKQIQVGLSQVKLSPSPAEDGQAAGMSGATITPGEPEQKPAPEGVVLSQEGHMEISPEYQGAGKIFLKATLWDLGIFSTDLLSGQGRIDFPVLQEMDWKYYLTYSKGVRVMLENNKSFFIGLCLPLERCLREVADGLINNVNSFIADKVSDQGLFKACMDAQAGFKMTSISIVDCNDHVLFDLCNIMEHNRGYIFRLRVFVERYENDLWERSKAIFFSQDIDNNTFADSILDLKGFDAANDNENTVTLLVADENKAMLQEAAEKLNGMYLRDEQGRLVSVKIG